MKSGLMNESLMLKLVRLVLLNGQGPHPLIEEGGISYNLESTIKACTYTSEG